VGVIPKSWNCKNRNHSGKSKHFAKNFGIKEPKVIFFVDVNNDKIEI